MLNREAREGGKLQSQVSGINRTRPTLQFHNNSTSPTRAQKKDTDLRKRKELIKRSDL